MKNGPDGPNLKILLEKFISYFYLIKGFVTNFEKKFEKLFNLGEILKFY